MNDGAASASARTAIRRIGVRPWLHVYEQIAALALDRVLVPHARQRRLALPEHAFVVGVDGVGRGGAGRTPVAIALAGALAARGLSVAFVGHGYRGDRCADPWLVSRDADVRRSGDEALIAARALHAIAPVVVGGGRERALEYAATLAEIIVVDRLTQARPTKLGCAILTIPRFDVPRRASPVRDDSEAVTIGGPECAESYRLVGLDDGREHAVRLFVNRRCGLITSMALPRRALRALRAIGIAPLIHVERADHAPVDERDLRTLRDAGDRGRIDQWIVDAKTAVLLAGALPGLVCLVHSVELGDALLDRIVQRRFTVSRSSCAPARVARP